MMSDAVQYRNNFTFTLMTVKHFL